MTKIGKSVAFCIGVSAIGMQVIAGCFCCYIMAFISLIILLFLQFLVKRRKTPADWKKVGSDAREALEKILPADRQVCLFSSHFKFHFSPK